MLGGKGGGRNKKTWEREEEWVAVMQLYSSSLVQTGMELIPYDVLPCNFHHTTFRLTVKSYIL